MKQNRFVFIWEIPLAILSFFFYKAMKFFIGNLYTLYLTINKEKTSQWRVLSAETLKTALSLPVLMTKGPRWNTHAIIGTLGPFAVKESIAIDLESANNSARSWIAVIYSFPSYETIASLESDKINTQDKWISLSVKPGKYSIGLRYYERYETINLPAIQVDKEEFVSACSVGADVNDFYYDLIKKKNWFYSSLHYYIFTILRLRKSLPETFVRNEYLPVGAPDTEFLYGYLIKGRSLQLNFSSETIENCHIYLTVYDRSSIPLFWERIEAEKHITKPIESNGYYLIRIRPKPNVDKKAIASLLKDRNDIIQYL
jgi:hypothetical protein